MALQLIQHLEFIQKYIRAAYKHAVYVYEGMYLVYSDGKQPHCVMGKVVYDPTLYL